MMTRPLTLAAVALLAACGGTTVYEGTGASAATSTTSSTHTSSSTGTGGNTASSTGVGADTASSTGAGGSIVTSGGTGGGTTAGPCPAAAPNPGDNCNAMDMDGQTCTYGDSVRPDCRTQFFCLSGSWMSTGGTCEQFTCPSVAPTSGDACGSTIMECNYGPTLCYCGCSGGLACVGPYEWMCADAPTTPGCPAIAPNAGTACSAEGASCSYGTTCTPDGVQTQCTNGFWEWEQVLCGG